MEHERGESSSAHPGGPNNESGSRQRQHNSNRYRGGGRHYRPQAPSQDPLLEGSNQPQELRYRGRDYRPSSNRQYRPGQSSRSSEEANDSRMQDRQAVLQETASLLSSLRQAPAASVVENSYPPDQSASQQTRHSTTYSESRGRGRYHNQASYSRDEREYDGPRRDESKLSRPPRRNYGRPPGAGSQNYRRTYDRKPETELQDTASASVALDETQKALQNAQIKGAEQREFSKTEKPANSKPVKIDLESQRERLTEQLSNGRYECMVCCDRIRPDQAVWGCKNCFHVFHLGCSKRWAKASQNEEGGWRCPACQFVNARLPAAYYCFCDKVRDPEWNRRETPHSCGEVCGRQLVSTLDGSGFCSHQCNLLCHPGPCPSCNAQVTRSCQCGKSSRRARCGAVDIFVCGEVCGKSLSCEKHSCQQLCHTGECVDCEVVVKQSCFCSRTVRELLCDKYVKSSDKFVCDKTCQKLLACGNHYCEKACHPGPCDTCPLLVSNVTHCPCGKIPLRELYGVKGFKGRTSCKDYIPTCGYVCDKGLGCGPEEAPHRCKKMCHMGPCPPCKLNTSVRCRCGKNEKEVTCEQLLAKSGEAVLCERRCNKKRSCGRHKCLAVCCVDKEHICPQECGRKLSCGLHQCEALCHAGNCPKCWQTSFDELRCHCGTSVMYPPVPCGTRPPECDQPCVRPSSCGHSKTHNCHADPNCPPCTFLCAKWCYGHHELRKNLPCYLQEVACGKPCGKPLPCGRHQCIASCHPGPCVKTLDNGQLEKCTQPCTTPRQECGHPCGAPCHQGDCPEVSCKEKVKVQCLCGQRKATVSCEEQQTSYRRMATSLLASKMAAMQSGQSVDLKNLLSNGNRKDNTKSLECNEECAVVERNRRLALALQIRNPDLSTKPGPPKYPDLLKEWTKKDPRFVTVVHDKLTDLVQLAKQSASKQRSRSFSFDPMNRDKRQVIHEYAEFFGCETVSYDEEPKRNVVATAFGETSWLPSVPLLEVVQRESGQRKMPAPALNSKKLVEITESIRTNDPTKKPSAWGSGATHFATLSDVVKGKVTAKPAEPVKDYFDYSG